MVQFVEIGFDIYSFTIIICSLLCCYIAYKLMTMNTKVDDITNKCVFITGCDSGFGRALALQLDKQNIPVFAGCLTTEGAKSLSEEASSWLKTVQVDVCSSDNIKSAYSFVSDNMKPGMVLWGVVNNAGIGGVNAPTEFLSRSDFEKVMQVNFFGQVDVINTFLPRLKKSKGRIVNLASIVAKVPVRFNGSYCASKFAVLGYTESLRLEKQSWGISVSAILPGAFGTNLPKNAIKCKNENWNSLPEEIKEEYGQQYHEDSVKTLSDIIDSRFVSTDLSPVTNAIEHALFARKPNAQYYPGLGSKVVYSVGRLPFGLNGYILGKINNMLSPAVPKVLQNK